MTDIIRRGENKPMDLFTQMRREMDDLFNSWFSRGTLNVPSMLGLERTPMNQFYAPLEIHENDGEYVVKMDVPGMNEKDLKVTCQGNLLTVSGERREQKTETKGQVRYSERSYGSFTRSVDIPNAVKQDMIRARYKDGVIEVHLPKIEKTPVRDVKVEVGG